ncbi:MAG TPA: TraR/DksA family transcriptional regulator [Methylomirabilota bacterium]|jgi:DnaK suppressor protein|nr:TraR/DksA family transcriptional regulator [Methylomirabilota bacterium]
MKPTNGNGKLDQRAAAEIERFLRARQTQLQESVRNSVTQRRTTEATRSADITSCATETLHTEIEVTLMDRHSRQVAQIQAALDRLARGEYGICHDCGEFIGLPRLRAMPFAPRCSPCQSRAELRARRYAGPVPVGLPEAA